MKCLKFPVLNINAKIAISLIHWSQGAKKILHCRTVVEHCRMQVTRQWKKPFGNRVCRSRSQSVVHVPQLGRQCFLLFRFRSGRQSLPVSNRCWSLPVSVLTVSSGWDPTSVIFSCDQTAVTSSSGLNGHFRFRTDGVHFRFRSRQSLPVATWRGPRDGPLPVIKRRRRWRRTQ